MRVSLALFSLAFAESPCPSEKCWSFDEETNKCNLLPGCAEVSCSSDTVSVEFIPEYFGVEGDNSARFLNSVYADGKYYVNCKLGDCDMLADYNEDGDIVFSVEIHDEQKLVRVGELELFHKKVPTTLTASCVYASTVSLSSTVFNVTYAKADHSLNGKGDFGDAFSMTIRDKDGNINEEVDIGEKVWIDIEWDIEQPYLGFFAKDCYVTLGDDEGQRAEIIKNGCYSSALGVTKTGCFQEQLYRTKAGFTFTSFSSEADLISQNVQITCDVKICFFGDESCYKKNCPSEPEGYEYTEFGCPADSDLRPSFIGACFDDKCFTAEQGLCRASGDPHFKTFDGEFHHFMGTCWHTFVKSTGEGTLGRPSFNLEVKADSFGHHRVSWTTGLRLYVNDENDPLGLPEGGFKYKIEAVRKSREENIDGLEIHDQITGEIFEDFFEGEGLTAKLDKNGITIETWFGLKITYQNTGFEIIVNLPDCYKNSVDGLCGNWDGEKYDQGLIEFNYGSLDWENPEQVRSLTGQDWGHQFAIEDDHCVEEFPSRKRRATATLTDDSIAEAVLLCNKLKPSTSVFNSCPAGGSNEYAECIFDVAVDRNNYCETGGAKSRDCIRKSVNPPADLCNWPSTLGCPQKCGLYAEFRGCTNICQAQETCANRYERNRCAGKNEIDSRCQCKDGYLLEGTKCVPRKECGCRYGNAYYRIGEKWQPYANYKCECRSNGNNGGYSSYWLK